MGLTDSYVFTSLFIALFTGVLAWRISIRLYKLQE